jgi:hypothetical protein
LLEVQSKLVLFAYSLDLVANKLVHASSKLVWVQFKPARALVPASLAVDQVKSASDQAKLPPEQASPASKQAGFRSDQASFRNSHPSLMVLFGADQAFAGQVEPITVCDRFGVESHCSANNYGARYVYKRYEE